MRIDNSRLRMRIEEVLRMRIRIDDQGMRIEEVLRIRIEDGPKITHFCRNFFVENHALLRTFQNPQIVRVWTF